MLGIVLNRQLDSKIILTKITDPELKPGEALIRIKAAALNHRDEWCRQGLYPNLSDGVILGSDGAGIVEKVFDEADSSWLGKEVIIHPGMNWGSNQKAQSREFKILGMPGNGTFAEFCAVPVDRLHDKPAHLSWEEAGALPLAGVTAYRALVYHGEVQAGDQVLVTGIGGGVAQFAAQFAKAKRAILSVSSSRNSKLEKAKREGADFLFNYLQMDWTEAALKATGGFDVIIDGAAGDTLNQLISVCRPGGKIVFYGATMGNPGKIEARKVFWNQLKIIGSTMGSDRDFLGMLALVEEHQIHPVIDQVFSLNETEKAFDRMKMGDQLGKIVLIP
ncbi:zinc-binding dehydrogenase [Algoriphagus boritolerans]|uniref:NADPH:quinone reductase n=2 Tax=Algoriphagus TaxID=246875 RepID=A0A1H5TIV3_9BACT|nr:zinc-binding dehydrogenase [Algoriphagus boritolerans]SEF62694.1 NADPH:quinone reductase [Algoriphagus boritolerans DSM 17298 = JCM 18970]